VQNLVHRHGGTVHALSEGLGRGSELVVRLPGAAETATTMVAPLTSARATPGPDGWANKRVLVVDDNQDAATLLAEALELRGCHVQVAFDGAVALRLASSARFDLFLLDIGLPAMDGYELAGRLRELGHREGLVALTGYGQPADAERALAAGFQRHLVKPVDLGELDRALRSDGAQLGVGQLD
jgi:CheY-like chemotaxis protein